MVSLVQPAINPLGNTRSVLESLAAWTGKPRPAYDLLREHWEKEVFPRSTQKGRLRGVLGPHSARWLRPGQPAAGQGRRPSTGRGSRRRRQPASRRKATYSLVLYSKVGMPMPAMPTIPGCTNCPTRSARSPGTIMPAVAGDGEQTGRGRRRRGSPGSRRRGETVSVWNCRCSCSLDSTIRWWPWPWATAACSASASPTSGRRGFRPGPPLGPNGLVGKNAAPLLQWVDGSLRFTRDGVRLTKTGGQHPLASTQSYTCSRCPPHLALPGQERRPIIRETTLAAYQQGSGRQAGRCTCRARRTKISGRPITR